MELALSPSFPCRGTSAAAGGASELGDASEALRQQAHCTPELLALAVPSPRADFSQAELLGAPELFYHNCSVSSLCVGLYRWLVKVSWLGKLVSVFWWMGLYLSSLECNEVSSNEL